MTSQDTAPPPPDVNKMFQPPALWGWQFDAPAARPFDEAAWQSRRREIVAELMRVDADAGRIGQLRRRLTGPRVNRKGFWASAAATFVLFFVFGLHLLFAIVWLVSLAALVYYWPYLGRAGERREVGRYDAYRAKVQSDLDSFDQRHRHDRTAYEAHEAHRIESLATWRALHSPAQCRRVEVIGGTKVGWEAFILTSGASLMASSGRLFVVDFTERMVATHLARIAHEAGRGVSYIPIPEQAKALDLFAGLSSREVVECLVAGWYDSADVDMNARADQAKDAFILQRIGDCLDGERLELRKLGAALVALLNLEVNERTEMPILSEQEQVRLERLMGEHVRRGPQFTDRLLALAAFLDQLNAGPEVTGPAIPLSGTDADLTLIELTPHGHALDKVAWASVIVQVLQRRYVRMEKDGRAPTHIIFAGVDGISRRSLDRLAKLTADSGIQLTILLETLRSDAAEIVGTGDSTQLFMRLGNRKDAAQAADQLGKEHRFVLSQLSTTDGDSVSETFGEQVSRNSGTGVGMMAVNIGRVPLLIPNVSRNQGHSSGTSWGKQTGKTVQTGRVENRVHEYAVEPEVLQSLGHYVFMHSPGHGRVIAGDCDPEIAYSPRAVRQTSTP